MAHIFNLFLFVTVGNIWTLTPPPSPFRSVSYQNELSATPVLTYYYFFGVGGGRSSTNCGGFLYVVVEDSRGKCFLTSGFGAG